MPRGRAFPQLVLDILSLKARLELASAVTHPTARRPVLFALVRYAVIYQMRDPVKLVHQRAKMVCAMEKNCESHCIRSSSSLSVGTTSCTSYSERR